MKLQILSIFVISHLLYCVTSQLIGLTLLKYKENFKPEILNSAFSYSHDTSDVIMLRISKKINQNKLENEGKNYELVVASLQTKVFKFFRLIEDKYFGYFEYKKHLVLVYGDGSVADFFSQTKIKKEYDFLPDKPYDYKNHPPIAVEPIVTIYSYINGNFTITDQGRLGFGR